MQTLGRITAALLAAVGAAAVLVAVRSAPDVKRYLKMRAM